MGKPQVPLSEGIQAGTADSIFEMPQTRNRNKHLHPPLTDAVTFNGSGVAPLLALRVVNLLAIPALTGCEGRNAGAPSHAIDSNGIDLVGAAHLHPAQPSCGEGGMAQPQNDVATGGVIRCVARNRLQGFMCCKIIRQLRASPFICRRFFDSSVFRPCWKSISVISVWKHYS